MNREIKFRIWDIKSNSFHSPNNFIMMWLVLTTDGKLGMAGEFNEFVYPNYVDQSNYIIQQYTGLKDGNGKEIYEGDVIEEHHFENWGDTEGFKYRGVVYWSPLAVGFRSLPEPDIQWVGNEIDKNCKIVGNIFETHLSC